MRSSFVYYYNYRDLYSQIEHLYLKSFVELFLLFKQAIPKRVEMKLFTSFLSINVICEMLSTILFQPINQILYNLLTLDRYVSILDERKV